jgi:hypothetical protein
MHKWILISRLYVHHGVNTSSSRVCIGRDGEAGTKQVFPPFDKACGLTAF